MRFSTRFATILFAALVLVSAPAAAQTFGVRAGASGGPEQFFFGGHFETPPFGAPDAEVLNRVHFRPNVELGTGDDRKLIAANFEFVYKFDMPKPWGLYAGAGPALNLIWDTEQHSEGGFNFLAGVEHESGLFAEVKTGVIESARFKVTVGYVVRK
jgi:hypothetical protein